MRKIKKTKREGEVMRWNCILCDKTSMCGEEAEAHLRDHWQDILEEEVS